MKKSNLLLSFLAGLLFFLAFASAVYAADPYGWLDAADCTSFRGWTCDPDSFSTAIDVHFYEDPPQPSTYLGKTTASNTRSDVASSCGGTTNHGFSFPIPATLKNGSNHIIHAYAINTPSGGNNPELSGSPKVINCPAPTPPPPPTLINPIDTAPAGTNTFSWNPVTGAAGYYFRITSNSTIACGRAGDYCPGPQTTTSATYNLTAGTNYIWWVHSYGPTSDIYGTYNSATITVSATPTPTPTPTTTPTPTPTATPTPAPINCPAQTTNPRVKSGLISTPVIEPNFGNPEGRCVVDPKAAYAPYDIDPYEDLKAKYYTQAKSSALVNKVDPFNTPPFSFDNFNSAMTNPTKPGDALFLIEGDLTIDDSNFPTTLLNKSAVIFVEGNLSITRNITFGENNTGLVLVVKGDVIIDPSVTLIKAVIISSGTIYTAGAGCTKNSVNVGASTNALTVNGSLISLSGGKIVFCRKLNDNNNPAEVIIQQPKYLVILRNLYSDNPPKWSEIP